MDNGYIVFVINGGAGKNVLATAVIKALKKSAPEKKIIILTAYKEVWEFNPDIYRCYLHGQTPYFYENYIHGKKNVKVLALEPYSTSDYILKKKHLIEIWCDLINVPYSGETPQLYFNNREIEYIQNNTGGNKKIFLVQTNGGFQQNMKISWMRDLPLQTAQKVVDHFQNEYRIIQIRRNDQPALHGVEFFTGNLREMFALIRLSEKRLFIDSISQHAAAALKKQSTVTWVRNQPEILGYPLHDNIVTRVEDQINTFSNSVFEPYDITGNISQCPFLEGTELFDHEEIIASIKNQKN